MRKIPLNESMRLHAEDMEGQAQIDEIQGDNAMILVSFEAKCFRGFEKTRIDSHTNDDDDASTITNGLTKERIGVDQGKGKDPEGKDKDPERRDKDPQGKGKEPERKGKDPEAKDGDKQWFSREPAM